MLNNFFTIKRYQAGIKPIEVVLELIFGGNIHLGI